MNELKTNDMPHEKLKAMRIKLGISQVVLSRILGVATRTIRERESGDCKVRAESFFALEYVAVHLENERRKKQAETAARVAELHRRFPN